MDLYPRYGNPVQCVYGAHNTIISTRAGKDIISSAINQAAINFHTNWKNNIKPENFISSFKKLVK